MSEQHVTRYLFAMADNQVWAYIVREGSDDGLPPYFELKPLGGMPSQDPTKCAGHMEEYLDQWKNAMGLMMQAERRVQGRPWQLPSLAGRSICLLADSHTRATFSEMTGYLDELWSACADQRQAYTDVPWSYEDFQEFLSTAGQPFGAGRQIKAVKAETISTNSGTLLLRVYGTLKKEKKAVPVVPPKPSVQPKAQPAAKAEKPQETITRAEQKVAVPERPATKVFVPQQTVCATAMKKPASAVNPAEVKTNPTRASKGKQLTAEQARAILQKNIEGQVDTVAEPR